MAVSLGLTVYKIFSGKE